MGKLAASSVPFSLLVSHFSLQRPWRRALVLGLVVALAGCSRPTPGLPRVWAGQSVSPNVQAQGGTLVRLTIRATNDASNSGYGRASRVRSFTTYPDGVRVLDFTSSDVGRLAPDDMDRAWVQEIDTRHNVVVVSFGPVDAGQYKTATLTLLVQTPPGTTLVFRTLLLWQNDSPDRRPGLRHSGYERKSAALPLRYRLLTPLPVTSIPLTAAEQVDGAVGSLHAAHQIVSTGRRMLVSTLAPAH